MLAPESRLSAHLEGWLGEWPPSQAGVTVIGSSLREQPGWDGAVRSVVGVATPDGAVLSVPPDWVDAVSALGTDLDAVAAGLPDAVGRPDGRVGFGVFRWSTAPASFVDAGEWVATDDPRVPPWLKPFNGDVLVAWDDNGEYGAGVGRKMHNEWGHELAVVTQANLRCRGFARGLVCQAARRVLADGAIPTYLHDPANVASAHVADSCNFPDVGWRIIGLW